MRSGPLMVSILALVGSALSAAQAAAASPRAESLPPDQQESPLRDAEPVEAVVADLEAYIPERMARDDIPGLAIALVRDGEVVWTEGFGVAGSFAAEPVTPETVFEVASISKVATTYVALRLVEQGRLSLDEPLRLYLSRPWLPPSERGDRITLRHLAAHSSGLTDNLLPLDKSLAFEPGSAFRYSGVGFMYVQEAVEQVTGRSVEDEAREALFEPLGMSSTSFVNTPRLRSRTANGHMGVTLPLLIFLVPFVATLAGLGLLGIGILRLLAGRWKPTSTMMVGACGVAAVLTALMLTVLAGRGLPNFVLLITVSAAAFALALAAAWLVGRLIIARLPGAWRTPGRRRALTVVWVVSCLVALLRLAGWMTVPVPRILAPQPSAIGSLRSSAPDLARFLIELAEPRHLSREMAQQIRSPQVSVDGDFSWGLGMGIQHSRQGDALWQNGLTFGYRSVMVIYPERGLGVVVLTNSDRGLTAAYDVAGRALGGKARWEFF